MGACICAPKNYPNLVPNHSNLQHQRIKSCQYWQQDNVLTVTGYIHELIEEYDLSNYKLPIDLIKLMISFYGVKCQIVGIGRNGDGEFGLGHNDEIEQFIVLPQFEQVVDSPHDIYIGMGRFIVKNVFNEIYSAGSNVDGSAGIEYQDSIESNSDDYDDNKQRIMKFMKILKNDSEDYIEIVSSGLCPMHTMFVCSDGNVYAAGDNSEGQFGNGKKVKSNYGLNLVGTAQTFNYEKICQILTGQLHTLFLTINGNVFCCGNNDVGQCGVPINNTDSHSHNADNSIPTPILVPNLPSNIMDIQVGSYHNVVLTRDCKVYTFGDRNVGNIEYPGLKYDRAHLDPCMKDKKIISIATGSYHTICIDEDQQCWLYGNNTQGELGNGRREDDVNVPHLFQSMKGFNDSLIAKGFGGGNHTVLLTHSKDKRYKKSPLISFGANGNHQCSSIIQKECIRKPNVISKAEIGIGDDCEVEKVILGLDLTIIIFA